MKLLCFPFKFSILELVKKGRLVSFMMLDKRFLYIDTETFQVQNVIAMLFNIAGSFPMSFNTST